jgi:1-deoxy-D-xylulose-5-phosphate reductoisomerase
MSNGGAKRLVVLGSTGSVGQQTLAVAADFPDRYRVVGLAAGRNVARLADQIVRFRPEIVSVADAAGAAELRSRLGADAPAAIETGREGLDTVAVHPADFVMAGLVGALGLRPTLAAIRAGRDIGLANKEVMVTAGALVRREVEARGVTLLPVDSEHSAIFQCLSGQPREDVARLILTASGGPFRTWDVARIARATVKEALNHPNWDMGPKITVDSATLMNKGLEVVEARWLFDMSSDEIEVVVHPQSIVHSLVEFVDGSVLAQLGLPDMRGPIAVALAHPRRLPLDIPRLDLAAVGRFDFETPDIERFPCLDLAYAALGADEVAPAVLNAANEVSVAAFLGGGISFPEIASTNAAVLDAHVARVGAASLRDAADVADADAWARARAGERLGAAADGGA